MDALRASTMLLLVPVHAASVLSVNGHPGAWAVAIYWAIHVFRLPLFFAMSGFFLALLLSRKGLRSTAQNRTLRIVVPLVVGLIVLIPLMTLASQATETVIAGDGRMTHGNPINFEPSFLWFLWYLLILDGVAIALYLVAPGLLRRAGRAMNAAIAHPPWGILLLAVPTALALWPQESWTATPQPTTLVPDPSALVYYTLFFGLGATLCAHRHIVEAASRNAWRWVACAAVATVPAAVLFTLHNSPAYSARPVVHAVALLIYATATWSSLLALVGLANRYLNRPRPAVRYLADSSYWIYLSHMPAMVLIVALVTATSLGTATQFGIVTICALAVSLITYPLFVRYTVIGRVLNGRRDRAPGRGRWRPGPHASAAGSRPSA